MVGWNYREWRSDTPCLDLAESDEVKTVIGEVNEK